MPRQPHTTSRILYDSQDPTLPQLYYLNDGWAEQDALDVAEDRQRIVAELGTLRERGSALAAEFEQLRSQIAHNLRPLGLPL